MLTVAVPYEPLPTIYLDELLASRAPLRIERVPERLILILSTSAEPMELWLWRDAIRPGRTRWLIRPAFARSIVRGSSARA